MNSLFFNFIKRAIIFPIIVVIAVAMIITFCASRQVEQSAGNAENEKVVINIDDYTPKDYDSFTEIKEGRYALTIKGSGIESAVLYDNLEGESDISNLFYLHKSSKEPWNNGCVKVISESWYQINKVLDVKVGDSIEADFYHGNDSEETDTTVYRYKVKSIQNCKSAKYINNFDDENTMLICASYDNMADKNQKVYYVIIAELEGLV